MRFGKFIWLSLLVPTLSAGIGIGLCAYWSTESVGAALFVVGGSLATMLGAARMIERQQLAAMVQMRHADLRGLAPDQLGIYQAVVQESFQLLTSLEIEAQYARRAQTEADARVRVRLKQIQRLERAWDALPHPVLILDGCETPLITNRAARQLLADDGSADAGQTVLERVSGLKPFLRDVRERADASRTRSQELAIPSPSGGTSQFRVSATHLADDDGGALGSVVVLQNLEQEIRERERQSDFVSSVAHEMKTPLSSMKAFVEMLMDGDIDDADEQQRLFGFIDVQVDRLSRMIGNMLNMARIESGVIEVRRVDCDLNEVLKKALQVVGPMAEEKQIRLVPQLCELYLPVHIDQDLFGQAVLNLLSNAVKYTPAGGEVRLRSKLGDDEVTIDVIDTGMGIPEADLQRLFQRFFRVERNSQAATGTGLGLALVQTIVTNIHNGRVTVQSKIDEGSCFTVAIPVARANTVRRKLEPALCPA